MAVSDKWRINFTAAANEAWSNVAISELVMASTVGGANMCTGGSADASSYLYDLDGNYFYPSRAFDGALGGLNGGFPWISWGTFDGGSAFPSWLEYTFASPVSVAEYGINIGNTYIDPHTPYSWEFQYWNGSTWVTVDTRVFPYLEAGGMTYFGIAPGIAPIRLIQQAVEVLRSNGVEKDVRVIQQAVEILRFNGYEAVGSTGQPIYPGDDPTFSSWFLMF